MTRGLLLAIALLSLAVSLCAQPIAGAAPLWPGIVQHLLLSGGTLPEFELGAVLTSPFVNLSNDPSSLFMPVLMLALFRIRELPDLIRYRWKTLLAWFLGVAIAGTLIDRYLVPGVWGLVGALLITAIMAPTVERMFGSRPFLMFCLRLVVVVNVVGALLLWAWPGSEGALLGRGAAAPWGIGPLSGAWFLTFALVLDGATLGGIDIALNGRALALILLVLDVYGLLFDGVAAGVMGIVALAMAWLHIRTGGSLRLLWDRLSLWRLERRRRRFRVVEGGRGGGGRGGSQGGDGRIVHRLAGGGAKP